MIILGITGPTGAGKSTVSKIFKKYGVEIIDTDILARKIVEPKKPALKELADAFGKNILNDDSTLKRSELARLAFSDPARLKILNSITHRYIKEEINIIIGKSKSDTVGIDGAVLFESGVSDMCDYIISVTADEDIRIKRIMARDSISEDAARTRIGAQKNNAFYLENSDYIVYNNGREDLEEQVKNILNNVKGA